MIRPAWVGGPPQPPGGRESGSTSRERSERARRERPERLEEWSRRQRAPGAGPDPAARPCEARTPGAQRPAEAPPTAPTSSRSSADPTAK